MYKSYLDEVHNDMPEKVLRELYTGLETAELLKILKKFRKCKTPDAYMLMCINVVENELKKNGGKI